MKEITLAALVEQKGRAGAARMLGCTAPAISFALAEERNIMVRIGRNTCTAYEVRPFPSQQKRNTEAA